MSDKKTDTTEETTDKAKSKGTPRGSFYLMDPDDLTIIGLDTKDGPEHPLYDPRIHRTFTEAEIKNVHFYGVKNPVKARRNGKVTELVDGRGRVLRARIVKKLQIERGEEPIKVPVMIEVGDDGHLFGLSRALNRAKLDGPITNAQSAQRLMAMGKTLEEVATSFEVTTQTITNWLTLLSADPAVIDAMVKEEINPTSATAIAALPREEQKEVLADIKDEQKATNKKVSTARVQAKVRDKAGKTAGATPKEKIERCKNVLIKFQLGAGKTKDDYAATLERVARILTGHGLEESPRRRTND